MQALARRFQSIAEGDFEVVNAVTLLGELPDGEQHVELYNEIQDAAVEAGIEDLLDLLLGEPTHHADVGDCSNDECD